MILSSPQLLKGNEKIETFLVGAIKTFTLKWTGKQISSENVNNYTSHHHHCNTIPVRAAKPYEWSTYTDTQTRLDFVDARFDELLEHKITA